MKSYPCFFPYTMKIELRRIPTGNEDSCQERGMHNLGGISIVSTLYFDVKV
jgi:hypothetical protein